MKKTSVMITIINALARRRPRHLIISLRIQTSRGISEESTARYCAGGYHPVRIGYLFNQDRYQIVSKLGYGAYSTVWLAFDRHLTRHVALKILTVDSYGQENDIFEIDILKHMRRLAADEPGALHILQLLDNFQHDGPNGTHACLVFPAMGPDLTNYSELFPKRRIPAPQIKTISRQLLLGLSFLHDTSRVIHTDIKPQNILLDTSSIRDMFQNAPSEVFRPDSDACPDAVTQSIQVSSAEEDLAETTEISVKIADFGTASWFDKHLTEWIQPPMLRAPEVILGAEWDYKVDIWNLGLIIWELVEGQVLFDGKWNPGDKYSCAAHLAQMSALLGQMPKRVLNRAHNRSRYFDSEGGLLRSTTFPPQQLRNFSAAYKDSDTEKRNFLQFIESMVRLNPEKRLDASQLLLSPWLSTNPTQDLTTTALR